MNVQSQISCQIWKCNIKYRPANIRTKRAPRWKVRILSTFQMRFELITRLSNIWRTLLLSFLCLMNLNTHVSTFRVKFGSTRISNIWKILLLQTEFLPSKAWDRRTWKIFCREHRGELIFHRLIFTQTWEAINLLLTLRTKRELAFICVHI